MRFPAYVVLGLFLGQAIASAQTSGGKVPAGGMAVSPDGRAALSGAACAELLSSVAGPDYVPGVDVDGNKVAPADLAGQPTAPIGNIPIFLHHGVAGTAGRGGLIVGSVTVRDGRAYFDGAPLAPDDQAAIAAACRNARH
jgi:hypothetical protein